MSAPAAAASQQRGSKSKDVGAPELSSDGKTKTYMVHNRAFVVDAHYDVKRIVGYGAYGTVCAGVDLRSNAKVGIKKMAGVFDDVMDGKRMLREIKVLTTLFHPNVLKLRTVLAVEPESFNDLYLVTPLLDADLNSIIRSKQRLIDDHVKYFVAQLLRAIKYIHSANIIHRDIKPSNLLVNANCDLVLCDFGLARSVDNANLTGYVVTRWYRAPELLVLTTQYSTPVDMWSVGCILAELLMRRPLFQGKNYLHQLQQVIEVLGNPSDEDLQEVSDEARHYIAKIQTTPPVSFATMFPSANPAAADLLASILKFHPAKRMTAAQALAHPYLAQLHKEEYEPVSKQQYHFALEATEYTEPLLREAFAEIIDEVRSWEPMRVEAEVAAVHARSAEAAAHAAASDLVKRAETDTALQTAASAVKKAYAKVKKASKDALVAANKSYEVSSKEQITEAATVAVACARQAVAAKDALLKMPEYQSSATAKPDQPGGADPKKEDPSESKPSAP